MKTVRRAVVAREEQQSERDLRDQHRLRKREQVGDDRPRLTTTCVRDPAERGGAPRDGENEECDGAVRR